MVRLSHQYTAHALSIAGESAVNPACSSASAVAAITVAALILLLVRVRRHSFVNWVVARVRHRRTRRW